MTVIFVKRYLNSAVLIGADGLVLQRFWPDWSALRANLSAPYGWLAREGTDRAMAELAAAALWVAACWLACGILAALAGGLPGRAGTTSSRIAAAILPVALRRIVIAAAGVSLVVAPAPGLAATPHALVTPAGKPLMLAVTHQAAAFLSTRSVAATPNDSTTRPAALTLGWPTDADPATPRPGPDWPSDPPASTVTVRPGDTLWLIAAHRLPGHPSDSQIAGEWPRWYAANRAAIGAEPDLITPGTALVAPRPPATGRPLG